MFDYTIYRHDGRLQVTRTALSYLRYYLSRVLPYQLAYARYVLVYKRLPRF